MLTCKSLFGLGYRGERLIEPSSTRNSSVAIAISLARWPTSLRSRPQSIGG